MKSKLKPGKLAYFAFLLAFFVLSLKTVGQDVEEIKLQGQYKNASLVSFLQSLEGKYPIRFFYKKTWIDTITINQYFNQVPLNTALERIFQNQKIAYRFFQENSIILFPASTIERFQDVDFTEQIKVIGDPINTGRYKRAILKGKIVNGKNGELLIGAVVYSPKEEKGVSTNSEGYFEFDLLTGEHTLQISFVGFEESTRKIKLIETGEVEFELFEEIHNIEEVVVVGDDATTSKTQMSLVKVDSKVLKKLPVLMGETDVIKGVTMMAGVQTVGELASGFNVRGGDTDQNLILLDGAPVFNSSHLFGFLSMINPDVVGNINLYKGGLPARYGERISSVMEIDLKKGNDKSLKAYGGIGLINSRVTIDGPLIKNKKLKLLTGFRSSYTDWILEEIPDENVSQSVTNFYDASGYITYDFNLHNSISLMAYISEDEYSTSAQSINKYGNLLLNLDLRNKLGEKLSSELAFSYSKYTFRLTDLADSVLVKAYYLDNQIQYHSAKYHFNWHPHARHNIHFGANGIYYLSDPGEIIAYSPETIINPQKLEREKALETALYLSDEFDISPGVTLNAGLRYSRFDLFGPGTVFMYDENKPKSPETVIDSKIFDSNQVIKTYSGFEPRISLRYELQNDFILKMSYQRTSQYFNQISNNAVISPAESWKASDYHLKPLINDQVAFGVTNNKLVHGLDLSAELYYKNLKDLIEYRNGAEIIMNPNLETSLINADGYSYGIELSLNKPSGRLTGWMNYTFARTMRKTDNRFEEDLINEGKYYPSIYDKPHDLSVVANYNISRRWRVSGNFVLISGRPVTLPEVTYKYAGETLVYYSDRSKYRMPPYHRFDISITFDENLRRKRMWKGSWTLSVYNLYGRKNPYSIYYRKAQAGSGTNYRSHSLYKLSVIGIPVPSLTYNFTF